MRPYLKGKGGEKEKKEEGEEKEEQKGEKISGKSWVIHGTKMECLVW